MTDILLDVVEIFIVDDSFENLKHELLCSNEVLLPCVSKIIALI